MKGSEKALKTQGFSKGWAAYSGSFQPKWVIFTQRMDRQPIP
jgi:hypothetical protein